MSLTIFNHIIQLIGLALLFMLLALGGRWAMVKLRRTEIETERHLARDEMLQLHIRDAEDAIATVIVELESHPATYATFPQDVRDKLYAAHEKTMQIRNKA